MYNSQKNKFFKAIVDSGLDPKIFVVLEFNRDLLIFLKDTEVTFKVSPSYKDENKFTYESSPTNPINEPIKNTYSSLEFGSGLEGYEISYVVDRFKRWINDRVKPYLEEQSVPDLWKDYINASEMFFEKKFSYTSFTHDEKLQVKVSIEQFELLLIKEYAPTQEQIKEIHERLDYLKEAVDRLNKFDWKAVAISTVIGIATTMLVDTSTGGRIWALLQQSFQYSAKFLLGG